MRTMLSMSWTEKSFAVRGEPPYLMCCFKPPRFVSCPYELRFVSGAVKPAVGSPPVTGVVREA